VSARGTPGAAAARARGRVGALAAAAAALLLTASAARASCCIFEDPLLSIGDVAARGGHLRVALETEVLSSGAAMDGHDGMAMREAIRQATLRTIAVYSPLERLNLVAAVPFSRRDWRVSGGEMPGGGATLDGLGDVDVGARIALWRRVAFVPDRERIAVTRVQAVAVSVGTSLPTGENGARSGGVRLDEHAQLGTGAWGPYAGLVYRRQREPWAFAVSASARVRTENAHGYRFGSAVLASAGLEHELLPRMTGGLGADVRFGAPDARRGHRLANTGGLLVSATPSVAVGLGGRVRAQVRAQLPVLQRLRGDQRAGAGFVAGMSWEGP
jgi:hypothetical protein